MCAYTCYFSLDNPFIYAVWNAVLLDALTDFYVRFVYVCPEARLQLRLNALEFIYFLPAENPPLWMFESAARFFSVEMLWLLWFETWQMRRKINVSPSIIFQTNIKVVKKINTLRQAILTSPLLFGRSTVGSPGPPPLWLVGWLESDRDECSVLSKVEHSSTLGTEKKTPDRSARSRCSALRTLLAF